MIIYIKEKKVAIMAENKKGTFIVKINHTDNASWQGQVTWADKNITVDVPMIELTTLDKNKDQQTSIVNNNGNENSDK